MSDNKNIKNDAVVILRNDTIERAVIGTMLRYNELYLQNADILREELFHESYRPIYVAIKTIVDGGGVATPVTVTANIQDKGQQADRTDIQRMVALCDKDSFQHYVRKLDEYDKRNTARLYFQQYADEVVKMSEPIEDTISRSNEEMRKLLGSGNEVSVTTAAMVMNRIKEHVLNVREGNVPQGIMTGFRIFDINYGLHDDQLIIIAARTGVGKSSFAMNVASNVAQRGVPTAYYSLEMGAEELWARVISADMEMRAIDILYRKLADFEMDRLSEVAANYAKYPLYIDEQATVRFERLVRSIRKMVSEYAVKLVVIDYLQIIKQDNPSENEAISLASMTRDLKNLAKELHIPIIVLSQLNRGGAKDGTLSKFGLRGSGEIEEAADMVVMIDRPDADPNTRGTKFSGNFAGVDSKNKAVFRLDKGRNTGGSEFLMDFNPEYTLFSDNGGFKQSTEYKGEEIKQESLPFGEPTDDKPF